MEARVGTENIGGIDVVIQAHDAQYNAAMRRAAATAPARRSCALAV